MKIYIHDENGRLLNDKNHNHLFYELMLCEKCRTFLWSDDERALIRCSVEIIFQLSEFELAMWQVLTDTDSGNDANELICLGGLLNPLREPFEYDNVEIGFLLGALQLATFAGPAGISTSDLNKVCSKIKALVTHIQNEHRDEKDSAEAPSHLFRANYLPGLILSGY